MPAPEASGDFFSDSPDFFGPIKPDPVLPFHFFFRKIARKTPKEKQGFFVPAEPLESLEKKGKTLKKKQGMPRREKKKKKKQGIPTKKNKERKDRVERPL